MLTRPHRLPWLVAAWLLVVCLAPRAAIAADKSAGYAAALESIAGADLLDRVQVLADKGLEGREAGTPGGRAAADYLTARLEQLHLAPAGTQGYFQPFPPAFRNILATVPGSDAALKGYVVLVGAHYDHLGHGLGRKPSDQPGPIYPGADDNASGTSGVLSLARALTLLPEPPKRSIVLAWWDAEEKGLLGSKYWTAHPTVPLGNLSVAINLDMIGTLRQNRLSVYGSRSGYGLRRLLSEQNRESGLLLDFCWTLRADADHFSFFQRGIPVVFFNTGLHERYHQPTDDAAHVDADGMMRVARLAFAIVYELANQPAAPRFRAAAGGENEDARRRLAEPDPSPLQPGDPPLRLGVSWRLDEAEPGCIVLSHVVAGSPAAAAGLRVGDRIYQVAGRDFAGDAAFADLVKTQPGPLELLVERDGQFQVVTVRFAAEPGAVKRAA